MPLPQRNWYRIGDVAKRWSMSPSDIEDYALDEILQLSVFVVELPVEANGWELGELNVRSPHGMLFINGPQPLLRASLLEIFRAGQAEVRCFPTQAPHKHVYVRSGTPPVIVRREDLILTRDERDRFEREHAVVTEREKAAPADAWHSEDFSRVRLGADWHSFGPKQAAVLRLLKTASEGDNPWLDGKRLLDEADAATMRLVDLFKRKPAWRQLIQADGKGRYRLHAELLSPERRRVRFYRRFNWVSPALAMAVHG
ncbi:MAG: hypothetical protein WBF58_22035 [Xanthobacteraceae bacterium]